jgi:folate-binding protein YgfZ
VESVATRCFLRARAYVGVRGVDASPFLQRILSNDITAAEVCEALLLTAKGRVLAPLVVWTRAPEDYLLLTEPELGEVVRAHLDRLRVAARCVVELEQHRSVIAFGTGGEGIPTRDYGVDARELLDPAGLVVEDDDGELERLRILARTPRWGKEIDDTILPAEAGLDERAISFTKGCFPGQEPVARLHARGHVNRRLRLLRVEGAPAEIGADVVEDGRVVGRVTSAVEGLALAYVRVEVTSEAPLEIAGRAASID